MGCLIQAKVNFILVNDFTVRVRVGSITLDGIDDCFVVSS